MQHLKLGKSNRSISIAQAILIKTMLSNPFVAILTAVVGLVTAFIYLWKTNEGFRDAVKTFGKYTGGHLKRC